MNPWLYALAPACLSCAAKAAQVAEASHLSSGAADAMHHAHPFFSTFVHGCCIFIVVSLAALILSTILNPRSMR